MHPQLVVKGGLLGTQLLDANGANALADLPTREVSAGPARWRDRCPDAAVRRPASGSSEKLRLRAVGA